MKTFKYIPIALLAFTVAFSCRKVDEINQKLDALESRIVTLEEAVTDVNNNAVSIQNLMDANIVITSFKQYEFGYEITFNNGQSVKVSYGKEAPGVVPIIGVDKDGDWVMSIDGGETFVKIGKGTGPYDYFGITPQIRVDNDGYWNISMDGGKTWEKILGNNGLPISAVDGREVAGKYSFFTNVTVDVERNQMIFHLATGETVTVPIECSAVVVVKEYTPKETIFSGETLSYEVELTDVASAAWLSVPKGWEARLDEKSLTIIAPDEAEDGEYEFILAVVSPNGLARQYEYVFTYESYIFYDNFDKGDVPNQKYWELCPRKYSTGWTMYMSESYDNTYLKDGKLVLKAEKVDGIYKSAGVQTKFGFEKCRVELSARYTKMVTSGINSAAWLFPYSKMVWPQGGEVDIFEHLNDMAAVWQTCHTHYTINLGGDPDDKHKKVTIDPDKFNTYAIDLTEEAVIFYINGKESFRYANKHFEDEAEKLQYPFYKDDFYLLLDCCLGTEWPGPVVDEELPGIMEVDWVKISRLK